MVETDRLGGRLLSVLQSRLIQVAPVLLGVTLVTFLLVRLLPGGPAQTLVGVRASPEAIDAVNRQLGLDQPLPTQYGQYLANLAQGDLGSSLITGTSVGSIIGTHLGTTLLLIGYAVLLASAIGVPLAIAAAHRRGGWVDRLIRGVVVVGFGLPSFWIGVLLLAFLSLRLGLFPSGGSGTGFIDRLWHLFLPALTLGLTFLAVLVRSLRASIADILRADYVDAARLKGLPTTQLLRRHILRTSLLPVITLIGLNMSFLLGTSVIVENVFAVDGIGQQLVAAVLQRDFLVVQGIAFVFGLIVIGINLAVDLLQTALDPRYG
jgi:peptide/nickel transport system permease protein